MTIRFGPAGLGSIKDSVSRLETYHKLGLKACEIAFTYGVYIKEDKHKKEIKEIEEAARKYNIELSIHAPYWINLNSKEKRKIEESKKRILDCCKIGGMLGVTYVVFHPGYYGGMDKEKTYQNIKKEILEMQKEIKKQKWKVKLAPETTGKINVFGSIEEILLLVKETSCFFTLDFAHLLARSGGKENYKEMYSKFKQFKNLHCHFSGINWGEKGERSHKVTSEEELRKLLKVFPRNKEITIINESPESVQDSVKSLRIFQKL